MHKESHFWGSAFCHPFVFSFDNLMEHKPKKVSFRTLSINASFIALIRIFYIDLCELFVIVIVISLNLH